MARCPVPRARRGGSSPALHVERQLAVDQDHQGTGLPARLVPGALRRLGPGQCRAEGVRRIRRGQDDRPAPAAGGAAAPVAGRGTGGTRLPCRTAAARAGARAAVAGGGPGIVRVHRPARVALAVVGGVEGVEEALTGDRAGGRARRGGWCSAAFAGVGHRAQPVHRAVHRELCRAEPLDHIAAAGLAAVLEGGQDAVHRGEAALDALGADRASGHHPVPVEEGAGERVGTHGGVRLR